MKYCGKLFFIFLLSFKSVDAYCDTVDVDIKQMEMVFLSCVKVASRLESDGEKLEKLKARINLNESLGNDASYDIKAHNKLLKSLQTDEEYKSNNCTKLYAPIEYVDEVCNHPAWKSSFCDNMLRQNR